MKPRTTILALVLLLVTGAVVCFAVFRTPKNEPSNTPPEQQTSTGQNDNTISGPPAPLAEKPYKIVDLEFPKGVKRGAPLDFTYQVDREKRLWKWLQYEQPNDLPQIEIRFVEKKDGKTVPFLVQGVAFRRWANGTTAAGEEWEFGGIDFEDDDDFKGAYAIRLLLAGDVKQEGYQFLCMGKQYYVWASHMGWKTNTDTPDKWGCKVITIPHVKRGQLAIMEVDVTSRKDDPTRMDWKRVKLAFKDHPAEKLYVYKEMNTKAELVTHEQIDPTKDVTLRLWEYGGAMVVFPVRDKYQPEQQYVTYYRGAMDRKELVFPDDADLVATPETVVTTSVHLPDDLKSPETIRVFWLLGKKDDRVTLAWANGPLRSHKPLGKTIQFTYIPGTYYLAVLRKSSNDTNVIGKVTFTKADAGKTIEIQPLQESP